MIDWDQPIFSRDDVLESAIFGQQVEAFLSSDIGKYLTAYADSKVREATDSLATVSPWRTRRIRDLQGTILLWKGFRHRLSEALTDGEQAIKLLEGDD